MNDKLLSIVGFFQQVYSTTLLWVNRSRRYIFLPIFMQGGRDMVLLPNGQWIDDMPWSINTLGTVRYNAETHSITSHGSDTPLRRHPWLSVISEVKDLSDFFVELRVSENVNLSNEAYFMLYAHQKGCYPPTKASITLRDGTIVQFPQVPVDRSIEEDINYIR